MIRRVVQDPRVCGLSVCRTLYDLVSGKMRSHHAANEGIYNDKGTPRMPIMNKIKAVNDALYDYVLNPLSDEELAQAEGPFLEWLGRSHEPA